MTGSEAPQANIAEILKSLPSRPGVYRMCNADGEVIYVGKALNLKKRVSSYFQKTAQDMKTVSLVRHIADIQITVTHTEGEALLLENNLIKELKPRYNILYRDDKSYPYIYITLQQDFPRLTFHRGALKGKGKYFGPYPSAGAVRETLALLQKVFPVRQCSESFYKNRSRPCLQYQIKRCTAPCVGLVDKPTYAKDVEHVMMFLEGNSAALIELLADNMQTASDNLEFETAARLRDQIANLRRIQEKQYISQQAGDVDVIAAAITGNIACVQVFAIRDGRNLGNKSYYPKQAADQDITGLLNAFLPHYYLQKRNALLNDIPNTILISENIEDITLLQELISERKGSRVEIKHRIKGERKKWLDMAVHNAEHAVATRLTSQSTILARFESLQTALKLDELPQRIECFDISHTMGEETVASCVVFSHDGAMKSDYRRYNIKRITPGDDYAAMEQALLRRYQKVQQDDEKLPDIVLIDGGVGQTNIAQQVFDELQLADVLIVGVSKGPTRKAGMEKLILSGCLSNQGGEFILPADSAALHLIQQIRDEAHRFAISGHRQRRLKKRNRSVLEDIEGLGPKRRQKLLTQFGGLQEVAKAGVDDLASVSGISKQLAQRIYDTFHSDNH